MNNPQVTKRPSREEWGQIWFEKLQQFHRTKGKTGIHFDRDQVVAFLQAERDQGVPAWKRLRIVGGLICYRDRQLRSKQPELESIRKKLKQIASDERATRNQTPYFSALLFCVKWGKAGNVDSWLPTGANQTVHPSRIS